MRRKMMIDVREYLGHFNPRIPCGMRLSELQHMVLIIHISIHASHAGCDPSFYGTVFPSYYDFNPRIPCGMRLSPMSFLSSCIIFQSTHPMRDATELHDEDEPVQYISIHASHAGCDKVIKSFHDLQDVFQSTHPMRDATKRR